MIAPLPLPQHYLKRFGILQLELTAAISANPGNKLLRTQITAHHPAIHAQRLYLCPHAIKSDLHIAIRLEMIHRAADRPLSTRTRTPSKRASRTSQEQPRESGEDAAFGKCQPAPQAANANQPLRGAPLFLQRGQVLLVEMVILLHEEHIRHTKYQQHAE